MCFNIRNIHSFQLVLVLASSFLYNTTYLELFFHLLCSCFGFFSLIFSLSHSATNIYSDSMRRGRISRWLEIEKQTLLNIVGWDFYDSTHTSSPRKLIRFSTKKQTKWKSRRNTKILTKTPKASRDIGICRTELKLNGCAFDIWKEIDKIKTDAKKRKDSTIVFLHSNSTLATVLLSPNASLPLASTSQSNAVFALARNIVRYKNAVFIATILPIIYLFIYVFGRSLYNANVISYTPILLLLCNMNIVCDSRIFILFAFGISPYVYRRWWLLIE